MQLMQLIAENLKFEDGAPPSAGGEGVSRPPSLRKSLFKIRNKKGKRWSLIRNRNNPNLLGVVNHGSINNHKFRGYEWFTDSAKGTLLGLTGAY